MVAATHAMVCVCAVGWEQLLGLLYPTAAQHASTHHGFVYEMNMNVFRNE